MPDMRAVLGDADYLRLCHNHDCGPFVEEADQWAVRKRYKCGRVDVTRRNNPYPVSSLGTFAKGAQEMPDEGRLVLNTGSKVGSKTIPVRIPNALTGVGVQMNEDQTREYIHSDARNRAWRTFLVNGGLDVLIAVAMTIAVGLANVEWTLVYWAILGTSVVKTIGATYLAYLLRKKLTPAVGLEVR